MSVFHQIGHDSINLVHEEPLQQQYKGMVCSPLNYSESKVIEQIQSLPTTFQTIFDPQIYFPHTMRGKLREWSYFPNDFETADQTSESWWASLCDSLLDTCVRIGCSDVCSPCIMPGKFSPDYYKFSTDVGNYLQGRAKVANIGFYQTAIIDYASIKMNGEAETIASILSQTSGDFIYLVVKTEIEPRREIADAESILGIMKLIRLLSDSGIKVFVGFCSSEFMLWKYAGASAFATGKFFNLRRFTSSRFDEPSGKGGGQLPYWFERSLVAYLREGDLVRLAGEGLLHAGYKGNPYSIEIINLLESSPETAWLALSWKNYLYAFAETENELACQSVIRETLVNAENNWQMLEDQNMLMEEVRNDGSWIRPWRIALNSFDRAFA